MTSVPDRILCAVPVETWWLVSCKWGCDSHSATAGNTLLMWPSTLIPRPQADNDVTNYQVSRRGQRRLRLTHSFPVCLFVSLCVRLSVCVSFCLCLLFKTQNTVKVLRGRALKFYVITTVKTGDVLQLQKFVNDLIYDLSDDSLVPLIHRLPIKLANSSSTCRK